MHSKTRTIKRGEVQHERKKSVVLTGIIIALCFFGTSVYAAKCLYTSSHHKGYAWRDEVEKDLLPELEGNFEFKQFDMDTKINTSEEFRKKLP